VASKSPKEHADHLREVLQRLEEHGLVLNGEKCMLGVSEVEYLGHVVSATGVRPLLNKVEAISQFPRPANSKSLQCFLEMRRFVRGAAQTLKLLTDALCGGRKEKLAWSEEMTTAFEEAKRALINVAELGHPVSGAKLVLSVDASDTHAGAVLQQ